MADLVTPNLPEASALIGGKPVSNVAEMRSAAEAIHQLGPRLDMFSYLSLTSWHLLKGTDLQEPSEPLKASSEGFPLLLVRTPQPFSSIWRFSLKSNPPYVPPNSCHEARA